MGLTPPTAKEFVATWFVQVEPDREALLKIVTYAFVGGDWNTMRLSLKHYKTQDLWTSNTSLSDSSTSACQNHLSGNTNAQLTREEAERALGPFPPVQEIRGDQAPTGLKEFLKFQLHF